MSIDTATAAKVAKLARIKVEDYELPALAEEIMHHVHEDILEKK